MESRPKVRSDCLPGGCNEERPCPWVGCRHHLLVARAGKRLALSRGGDPVESLERMHRTCALDVVAVFPDGLTVVQVAAILGEIPEKTTKTEIAGLVKVRRKIGGS